MGKKIKKYKVGVESETYAISLVSEPAIEETLVALEKQKEIQVQLANEEKHMVYSAVLIPDKPIYRRNEDGDEFYVEFTKESIEKMSQQFFKDYRQDAITLDHETNASDITVVESWIKTDLYKDKSVALGLNENLPVGTWFCGMKVNQIDAWERIKNHELNGFSVESLIRLEEFSKEDKIDNNMTIETNDMGFWNKMKEILEECFSSPKVEEPTEIEPTNIDLEEQTPVSEPVAQEEPKAEDAVVTPNVENNPIVENGDPAVVAPKAEDNPIIDGGDPKEILTPKAEEEPKVEEPDNHLEELIASLKEEITALKSSNGELQEKIKEMGKQPSANPISVHSGNGNNTDSYSQWRETMRRML